MPPPCTNYSDRCLGYRLSFLPAYSAGGLRHLSRRRNRTSLSILLSAGGHRLTAAHVSYPCIPHPVSDHPHAPPHQPTTNRFPASHASCLHRHRQPPVLPFAANHNNRPTPPYSRHP